MVLVQARPKQRVPRTVHALLRLGDVLMSRLSADAGVVLTKLLHNIDLAVLCQW